MSNRHCIPDDPIGFALAESTVIPAPDLIYLKTGRRITDTTPTRHDGTQRTARMTVVR